MVVEPADTNITTVFTKKKQTSSWVLPEDDLHNIKSN